MRRLRSQEGTRGRREGKRLDIAVNRSKAQTSSHTKEALIRIIEAAQLHIRTPLLHNEENNAENLNNGEEVGCHLMSDSETKRVRVD